MYQWLKRLFAKPDSAILAPAASPPPQRASTPEPGADIPAPPEPLAAQSPAVAGGPDFDQKDLVNSTFQRWLFALHEGDSLDTTPPENAVLAQLATAAKSGHEAADMLRRMPGVIPQLLQSLRSDNFAGADVARKISNDLVLVGTVLRLANAAMHQNGAVTHIASVEHAVIVIGQEGLRQLVTSVAFRPIVDLNSGHYTRLMAPRIWDQSEKAAIACRMLAPEFGVDPFQAFLAGLVQNAGLLMALRIMDNGGGPASLGSAMFRARLQKEARAISAGIAEAWRFPPAVLHAIREQDPSRRGGASSAMGRVLALGDYLSKIRLLAAYGEVNDTEHNLFDGLPLGAMPCYAALG